MAVKVEAVCVSTPATRVAKDPQAEVMVGPLGLEGDRHAGETYFYKKTGQSFPNRRQWSAVSTEEVEAFCRELETTPFPLGALGENIRLSGIILANVTKGTVLEFPSGCRLLVSAQNDPCENAAAELGARYGAKVQRDFVKVAFGRRGILGIVLTPGAIRAGDEVTIVVPEIEAAPVLSRAEGPA
jgi:MOSC domain-containing protein YiiM